MIYQIYEWHLLRDIDSIPQVICFMISGIEMENNPSKLRRVIEWCLEISDNIQKKNQECPGIKEIIIHINTGSPEKNPPYMSEIRNLSTIATVHLHYGDHSEVFGNGVPVIIAIGKSGREEIADAIQAMASDNILPEHVTNEVLEKYLTFSHTPDCVIKTGGAHLVDFLIWQSVYSELFFLDLNWEKIRKIDLLRAFRDFQARNRRFGA
jgi:undecaprenyl diphosphate synthase